MAVRNTRANFSMLTSDGEFTGYAVVWGQVNDFGEAAARGAFADAIKARVPDGKIRLLREHDTADVVGHIIELKEDDRGLWMRAKLNLQVQSAREVLALMEAGDVNGLSIGFDPGNSEYEKANIPGVRLLVRCDLWEVSIVALPALEEAQVDRISVFDRIAIGDDAAIRISPNSGYLTAEPRVSRTGVQVYKGHEVGRPDLDSVRVYRPAETVFDEQAMLSLGHKTITDDHPPVLVDSNNWKRYAVGITDGKVIRDGEYVRVPMSIMDAAMVGKIKEGKKEISVGYLVSLDWKSGKTDSGEQYDAVQTGIRANHIAIVDAARGGSALRIGDEKTESTGENKMLVLVDGINVEMTDMAAQHVNRAIAGFEKTIAGLRSKLTEEEEEKKKAKDSLDESTAKHAVEVKTKDGEIEGLKKQVADSAFTPDKLQAAVAARTIVVDKSKRILGDKLVIDGKTNEEIMRQVVDAHLGGEGSKGWSDAQVAAGFSMIKLPDGAPGTPVDPNFGLRDALINGQPNQTDNSKLYEARDQKLRDAWRGPTAGKA